MKALFSTELKAHFQTMTELSLRDLFAANPKRAHEFCLEFEGLFLDYSKQKVVRETMQLLMQVAKNSKLDAKIAQFFAGDIVNYSENKAALHFKLREPQPEKPIQTVLRKMHSFAKALNKGTQLGATKKPIRAILSLGIGGSDLGISLGMEALAAYRQSDLAIKFHSNLDTSGLDKILQAFDPETSICIINSKSFSTIETLSNAKIVKAWFVAKLGEELAQQHLFAVTANAGKALSFGVPKNNQFLLLDTIGGRYSIWSSVGLPLLIAIGSQHFNDFLAGAHAMDLHFKSAPMAKNMPIIMALIGIWNINYLGSQTQAILPYDERLKQLPSYLQQLEMESNGKIAKCDGGFVQWDTAPIIWGAAGCHNQHSFMQLLHQGTKTIPVDFIMPLHSNNALQDLMIANCLAQSRALMLGQYQADTKKPASDESKTCPGNQPSSSLLLDSLSPYNLGSLIALYEHKVFVQACIWQINPFDQWGVELGKSLAKDILQEMEGPSDNAKHLDGSTKLLLQRFKLAKANNLSANDVKLK